MTTFNHTRLPSTDIRHHRIKWAGFVTSADVGDAVAWGAWSDCTVQAVGTFVGSLGITMQGSLDGGVTWFTLTDLNNASIVFTAVGGKAIAETVPLIRPLATAGSGGANVDIYLFVNGYQP